MFIINRKSIIKKICPLIICLLLTGGISAAEETGDGLSSAELTQFAVDMMGSSSQEAQVTGFDIAESSQIGYSSDGKVIQTISYENIGGGSVFQWGESGDMTREERTLLLDSVGDSGFIWQWSKDDVNQTISVRNSENIYLKQVIGGLKKILFPDSKSSEYKEEPGTWTFCGKAVNGKGGLPLCAEKFANKILDGKANARELYMLEYLEEYYDVFPPENSTPHVILTKWNLTQDNGSLKLKFTAHNFGKKQYNATLKVDLTQRPRIIDIDGDSEDMQEKEVIEFKAENYDAEDRNIIDIGKYNIHSMKDIENEVIIPINDMKVKNLKLKMVSE